MGSLTFIYRFLPVRDSEVTSMSIRTDSNLPVQSLSAMEFNMYMYHQSAMNIFAYVYIRRILQDRKKESHHSFNVLK